MVAHFVHRDAKEILMNQDLRKDLFLTDKDLEVLEIWIEGPISASVKGVFQDVQTDVSVLELQDPETISTVATLADYIWKKTPAQFHLP